MAAKGAREPITLEAEQILSEKEKYIEAMERIKEAKEYETIILYLTDIVKKGSFVLYTESAEQILNEAIEEKIEEGMFRPGILSRKKQIIPVLMKSM